MKKLWLLLLIPFLLAATYGPAPVITTFSSLTNRPNPSAAKDPAAIVLGYTNAFDGKGGIFLHSLTDTNTVDNDIYLPATSGGRWIRVTRDVAGLVYPLLITDGQISLANISNWFQFLPGTNIVLTQTPSNLTISASGGSGGSGFNFAVKSFPYTNINVEESSTIDPSVSLGTNLAFGIKNYSVTLPMLATINPESLLGFGQGAGPEEIRRISLGPNLAFTGDVLDAVIPTGSNQWQIGVNGAVVTAANLTNSPGISVSATGTNVTFALQSTGVTPGTYSNATITVTADGRITVAAAGSGGSGFNFSDLTNAISAGTNIVLTYTTNQIIINNSSAGGGDVYQAGNNVFTGTNQFLGPLTIDSLTVSNLFVDNLQLPFADVLLFANGSSNLAAVTIGTNLNFSGGVLSATGGGSGGTNGTVVTVNGGADMTRANLQNSSTVIFSQVGSNITATVTNVAGTVTSNVLQWVGGARFVITNNSTAGDFSFSEVSGIVTNISCTDCQNDVAITIDFLLSTSATNYFWTLTASETVEGIVAFEQENGRQPGQLTMRMHAAGGSVYYTGGYYNRIDFFQPVTVGASTNSGGGGSSTNLLVNGLLVTQANLTNSANVLWEVSGSDIRAILTNVSGGLTINATPISSPVLTNGPQLIWDISGSVITPILTNVGSSLGTNGAFAVAAFWDPGSPGSPSACTLITNDSVGVVEVYREEDGVYRITLQSDQPSGSYKRVEQAHISEGVNLLYESGVISNATYSTSLTNVFVYVRQAGSTSNYGTNHPVYLALYSEPAISGGGSGGEMASSDGWDEWDEWLVTDWHFVGNAGSATLEPNLVFAAVSGGVNTAPSRPTGSTGIRTASGAAVNTGGFINSGSSSMYMLSNTVWQWRVIGSVLRTNGNLARLGFSDSTATVEPVDALMFAVTNQVAWPVALSNSVKSVASSGFTLQQGVVYGFDIRQTNDFAAFQIYSNIIGAPSVLVYSDSISGGLPLGSSRSLGLLIGGYNGNTSNTNSTDILNFERMRLRQRN